MKKILLSLLLMVGCANYSGTLFINKVMPPTNVFNPEYRVYQDILPPTMFDKAMKYLDKTYSRGTQLVGPGGNVYSFREFAHRMGVKMPNIASSFTIVSEGTLQGMDYKDVWLSKGPPTAIFVKDDFVTWRYKDESVVVFYEGKSVSLSQ